MGFGRICVQNVELNFKEKGLGRGIYKPLPGDGPSSSKQIPSNAQWRLKTMISAGGFSAYQMVFGPNPLDLFCWENKYEDLMFAQDTSFAGQSVQQWKLRMRAQEAALEKIANRKVRRLLAYNRSFNCTDINAGDSVLFFTAHSQRSLPRGTEPAKNLDIGETGATQSF